VFESASTLNDTLYVPGTLGKDKPYGWAPWLPSWVVSTNLYTAVDNKLDEVNIVNLMFSFRAVVSSSAF